MIPIPQELLEQVEKGNVLLFVGERIARAPQGQAVIDRLTAQLAQRAGLAEPHTFPEAAQAYQDEKGRQALVQLVRDEMETLGDDPQAAHHLIAGLAACDVLATTCLDRRLERAFEEADRPLDVIVGDVDVAYEDERKAQLYKLRGTLDRPESLVLTEDDYEDFFEDQASISVVLQGYLARKAILFVGYDLADHNFKRLYRKVTAPLDDHARRAYAFGETPPPKVCRWCQRHGVEVIEADATAFLEALTESLAARARPPEPVPPPVVEQPAGPLPQRPYKLLDYYEAKDAAIFFGRAQETGHLVSLIHAHRLALLYGASGTGKTSLLLAGAVPRLERAEPPYETVYVRALEDPAQVIRRTLRRRLPEADLPQAGSLVDFLDAATKALGCTLVIILDQFEEFFVRLSPEFRQAFIAELGALYDAHDLPIKVVLSLRGDWLASVGEIEKRIPEVFRTRLRLLPLSRDQAQQAITAPVERLGVSYEPSLVEVLLDDLRGGEGMAVMPPQLQLVCSALYDGLKLNEDQITLADYEQMGGAQGVLKRYLESELTLLVADERALARGVLEELVTSQRTKAVKSITELSIALDVNLSEIEPVLEKLVRARLLRVLEGEGGKTAYELAHECLIREIGLSAEAQARKQAEELLKQETDSWRRLSLLIERDRFNLLNERREELHFTPENIAFMLRCAIRYDREVEYWIKALDSKDAVEVIRSIISKAEKWIKPQDRVNALKAAVHLWPETYEPLLCEEALAEDELLAQEALLALKGSVNERIVQHLTSWMSIGREEWRKAALVLAKLDSDTATQALQNVLKNSRSQALRLEMIETIRHAHTTSAQYLLAHIAIFDNSATVRKKAQQCFREGPDIDIAQPVFDWCVLPNQIYTKYFRIKPSANKAVSIIKSVYQIVTFPSSVYKAQGAPGVLRSNRSQRLVHKSLGPKSMDSLIEIIEKELEYQPGTWEVLTARLFLILLPLVFLTSLLSFKLSVLSPLGLSLLVSFLLLIGYWEDNRKHKTALTVIPHQLRDFARRKHNYNFLIIQGIPLFSFALGFAIFIMPSRANNYLLSLALNLVGALFFVFLLANLVVYSWFGVQVITRVNPWRFSWFIPKSPMGWRTAIKLLQDLDSTVVADSLERFVDKSNKSFPIKVLKHLHNQIYYVEAERLNRIFEQVFLSTRDPEIWYTAGITLKEYDKQLVEQIAHQKIQQSNSQLKPLAKTLLESLKTTPFRRLLTFLKFFTIIGIFCAFIALGFVAYLTNISVSTTNWEVHLDAGNPDTLWVTEDTGLYRLTLNDEYWTVSEIPELHGIPVKIVTCDSTGIACWAATSDSRIAFMTMDKLEWLDLPIPKPTGLFSARPDIKAMWAAKIDMETSHLWVQIDSELFVSSDMGIAWETPFDGLAIKQFDSIDERRAMFLAEGPPEPAQDHHQPYVKRTFVYITEDSGKTWEEELSGVTDYIWLGAYTGFNHSTRLSSLPRGGLSDLYMLSRSNQPVTILGNSPSNELWHSPQGWAWQKVFSPKESLGQRACGAWFSSVKAKVYGEAVLLYRSYALLDGEQGIYLSRDLGQTWERVLINQVKPAPLWRWHLQCGDAWR